MIENLKAFLDAKVEQYNCPDFISRDPIVIPHQFKLKQDIEIMGFFAAILAWGQRKTIINKCNELSDRMDNQPFEFIKDHKETDLKALLGFKHRTFNDTDLLYFVHFFQHHYLNYNSLEDAFIPSPKSSIYREEYLEESAHTGDSELSSPVCYAGELNSRTQELDTEISLNYFRTYFFSLPDFPPRTIKHVSSPAQKSTCKRLNMFLRWMVRKDNKGVDFGIWNKIKPSKLICPCDVHVDRVARKLNLITRRQTDWLTAVELTRHLSELDPSDPVKYDFALFGLGIEEQF
ncbi:TIGR02757 family protein [Paradesertivirga mongoliensis]|uniref:TIGR02757 family protein n=1 Tax=Paradesertivirga mongoliensis TaxID=2100740 RepID=A0ABW4ZN56_9SPHI|nr:TIGR02757 family protein [Pedobacter mongoliensis]